MTDAAAAVERANDRTNSSDAGIKFAAAAVGGDILLELAAAAADAGLTRGFVESALITIPAH